MNECEDTLQRLKNLKRVNEREIEQQTTQLQEQKIKIGTQKEETERQEREIQTNARIIKQARRKKQTLEKLIQTEEKQQQVKTEKFQKQVTELEKQKKLLEQSVTLMRYKEKRKREELREKQREEQRGIREKDVQILQDIYDQLDSRCSSSTYMQNCDTEEVLRVELRNFVEKMKMEFQRSSEEMEVQKKAQEQTERIKVQEHSKNDEQDDASQDAASSNDKVFEESLSQRSFSVKMEDSNSQDIRKSALKSLTDILQHLNLDSFYPNKLTVKSIFTIGSPKEEQLNSNMAFSHLQKLLMLNYKVRCITDENEKQNCTLSTKTSGNCDRKDVDWMSDSMNDNGSNYRAKCEITAKGIPQSVSEISNENDNLDEFLSGKNDSNNAKEKEKIHSMDVQMAVFHCADSFLRQYMVTKLSSCQYALPLLVPSPTSSDIELPIWTFRQIKKTWKPACGSSTTMPVCQVKTLMVFFCRLGSVSTSKSQLLNSVINPNHDTFFHRDSPGSSRNSLFIEGLVEIAWYCPAGNTDDLFSDITAFCNLHGDALDHRKQTDFLAERATVNVVLMQNMKLNDEGRKLLHMLHKSPKPLICLVSDLQKGPLKIGHGLNIKIGLRGRNQDDLKNELTSAIKFGLQKFNFSQTFSLEKSSKLAKQSGFKTDEDRYCQEGKNRARRVIKLLEEEKCSEIKVTFLPCQGKLWHDWSRKNKELHHLHRENRQLNRDAKLAEMKELRAKQRGINLKFINCFVNNLLSKNTHQPWYFVQWTSYFIDEKFSDQVSQVHLKYNSKWLEVQRLKKTQGKSEELKVLQKQLEEVSEELDTVTFGLEHIFREMGQIYEAWAAVPEEMGADVSAFPAVAADLLISGHPLELMDGDAAHVPLTWIESVLDKVTERLGDQRVFVLSVLGLQSTGKSTMLNTMFGLQFAVRAGRCTRGVFMQLLRVKEEVKEQLNFDYLFVLDTEGLKSLELAGKSTVSHDNELATFIICLANMTLINIFGENPAEIQGILQIVIQAILRMKNLKVNPSCMFVHQNITDLTSAEKNMEGRRQLQEKLDEITVSVAKEERCDVECFNDVIRFNIQIDVHYFAQLWEGNPPMAPPNPHYSESAERLKQAIFTAAAQEKAMRLSEFKVQIKELWNAVLKEDFLFSFKNSLAIAVYQKNIAHKH
ncbi:interferon-induced very large GTPase 1-like [Pygocentrus nattereri]|uniref:interferon-induced very large GTPase 1-like n=1 Tax=Pygocentrus nattereri TaxID=42514 RepID=UPI001891BD17|nr:interferon-induced very large GTPase 1-like [Pygocentrus nattereri]